MAPSTPRTMAPGVETATSTPHAWVNSHSFRMSLTLATTLGTPNSDLGEETATRLDLVVSGRRDHDVAGLAPASRAGQLTRVGEQPFGLGNRVGFDSGALAFDQQDLVAVVEHSLRHGPADVARTGYPDPRLARSF